jgi:hypothetical protein
MIIIASRPGKFGNLLIVYSAFLAWGLEHRRRIVNPAFDPYAHYFEGTRRKLTIIRYAVAYYCARLIIRAHISNRIFSAFQLDWHERSELESAPSQISSSRACFVQGWQFRANSLLRKHGAVIRKVFTPLGRYREQLDEFFSGRIGKGRILVGIHVRHGDYRTFENGRYFYTLAQYRQIMLNILHLLGSEKVTFMICSNVHAPLEELEHPRLTLIAGPGHELLDLYALSRCNFIAGPPSTYSMWASFYGEVPLYMIREPERHFTLSEFEIQDKF